MNRFTLSPDSETRRRSPEVSSTAFDAQPPDLPPAALMEMGFAAFRPLARCRRPPHPVFVHRLAPLLHASFRPRLTASPLRFAISSPPSGWEEDFHLQAVKHARPKSSHLAVARWLRGCASETAAQLSPFVGICAGLFPSTFPCQSLLHPLFLARLQVEGMALHILDNVFRLNLTLEAT